MASSVHSSNSVNWATSTLQSNCQQHTIEWRWRTVIMSLIKAHRNAVHDDISTLNEGKRSTAQWFLSYSSAHYLSTPHTSFPLKLNWKAEPCRQHLQCWPPVQIPKTLPSSNSSSSRKSTKTPRTSSIGQTRQKNSDVCEGAIGHHTVCWKDG